MTIVLPRLPLLSQPLQIRGSYFSSFFKNLGHTGRYFWIIIWRLTERFTCYLIQPGRFRWEFSPREPSPKPTIKIVRTGNDTPHIYTSSLPVPRAQPISREPSLRSVSRPYFSPNSSGISLHVIPPEDDDRASRFSSVSFDRRSSTSMTVNTANPMSSQILEVEIGPNGSRTPIARPAMHSDGIPNDYIYGILPHKLLRYKRERWIEEKFIDCEIEPNRHDYSLGELPNGWEQLTHPEGQPYFYHKSKKIVTDCWMWDPEIVNILNGFIIEMEDYMRSQNLIQSEDTVLAIEIVPEDGQMWCGYYFACSTTRHVFWLDRMNLSEAAGEVRGDISPTHIKLYLEHLYWFHWDFFPQVNDVTEDVYDLVLNALADARTDVQSSASSTVNHTTEDLREMTQIVAETKGRRSSASHWCLGRFMQKLVKDRYLNYHGQYGARLDHTQSVHERKKDRRTLLIKIFSPLLFAAPNALLESLTNHWVDQITIKARWVKFFTKMNEQWGQHIVQSSILLNANVAFLAIPSNDPSNNSVLQPHRTVAQIASYISILTSFGSMMLALLLVRKHKAKEDAIPLINDYHEFLKNHHHSTYGFEAIAIMYSLPYALLIWSMGSFFVAVVLMCFVVSTTVVRSIVGVASGLVFAVIIWCIQTFWDESGFQVRQHLKEMLPLLHKVFRIRGLEVKTPDESDTTAVEMDSAPAMQQEVQSTHEHDSAATQHMFMSWLMSIIEWRRGDRSLSRV